MNPKQFYNGINNKVHQELKYQESGQVLYKSKPN